MWNFVFCKMPSGFHDVQQMMGITKKERREKIHEIILQSFSYLMHAMPQTSFLYSESRESLTHSRHLMSKASLEYVIDITVRYAILKTLISSSYVNNFRACSPPPDIWVTDNFLEPDTPSRLPNYRYLNIFG